MTAWSSSVAVSSPASSGSSALDGNTARRLEAERFGHVLDLRQVGQVVQAEPDQELLRRRVQERPADDLLAADDLDQVRARAACSSTPDVLTPRISVISAAVIGCL